MKAEILVTGDEIRRGYVIDTNSSYISRVLETNGIEVTRHICVGDGVDSIISAILEISSRVNIAIVTGGLGSTVDDMTSKAVSKITGMRMVFNKEAFNTIGLFLKKFPIDIGKLHFEQSFLPEGVSCIQNEVGIAPGFSVIIEKCMFFFIPGVPNEAKYMLAEKILPKIVSMCKLGNKNDRIVNFFIFGLSESEVNNKLSSLEANFSEIKLGIYIKFPEIQITLHRKGENSELYSKQLYKAIQWVKRRISYEHIISINNKQMGEVIGDLLMKENSTLSLAESCTGGFIANYLTNTPGSSYYFVFSAITYSNQNKIDVLGVKSETIKTFGAVHRKTAEEMAVNARIKGNSTYGLSTSGIAGPTGGSDKKPVGTVYIGFSSSDVSYSRKFYFPFKDRGKNKRIFGITALNILKKELLLRSHSSPVK